MSAGAHCIHAVTARLVLSQNLMSRGLFPSGLRRSRAVRESLKYQDHREGPHFNARGAICRPQR